MKKFASFIFLFALLLLAADAFAAKRYWISSAGGKWNSTANWSSTSGGGGGSSVPSTSDTAYFDGGGTGNDTLDMNISVKRLEIASGYTGTIVQGSYTVTFGTSGATLGGGTFAGGSGSITSSGAFVISGCAFTSTSGTFSCSANFTYSSGSFTHNSGKLKFTATNTITGSVSLYQLEFGPTSTATFTIASGSTLTVNNTLTISGSATATLNTGNIHAKGNISITSTANGGGGSATITINGSGTQTLTGSTAAGYGRLPVIIINKTASDTLRLDKYITTSANWTYTAGIIAAGTSTVQFANAQTITGKHTLNKVVFSGGGTFTINSGDTLTVSDSLTVQGSISITLNTGVIRALGHVKFSNTGTSGGGSATLLVAGTGDQTITGGSANQGRFPNVVINKPSGTLTLVNLLTVNGNWSYIAGTVSTASGTVILTGSKTISGKHSLHNVIIAGGGTFSMNSGDTLTVTDTLTIQGTISITINSGVIAAKGNVSITNSATGGGGSAVLLINGTSDQTLTGSGTAGQGSLPKVVIDKPSGTLTIASTLSVAGDWTYIRGTVTAGNSSVVFYGTSNLDAQGSSGDMSFYNVATAGTTTLTGNLDMNNNLSVSSGSTLNAGNYTIYIGGNWIGKGTWNYDSSTVVFDGTGYKQITGTASTTISFYNVTFNKTAQSLTLALPVKVNHAMVLTEGHIKASTTNYLELVDNATVSGGGINAYVHGPVRKTGNDAFTFPLGDTTLTDSAAYHPLTMSAPGSITDQFEAVYKPSAQAYGTTLAATLSSVSSCQYWTFERKSGTSTPTLSLSWNSNCNNGDYYEMREALWNGTQWIDLGQAGVTVGSSKSGTVTASSATSFTVNPAPLTLAFAVTDKSYAVLSKNPGGGYYTTDGTVLYFSFDEEYADNGSALSYSVTRLSDDTTIALINNTPNLASTAYGNNLYKIDLYQTSNTPLSSGYYMLEISNDKNEKWYLRFKI